MAEALWAWLNINFMSHGHCYLWRPDLVILHIFSDTVIAAAYYSIPFALWRLKKQRPDLEHGWLLTLFAIFIFACGTTHVVNIWNIWHGHYYFSGAIKLITAVASIITAFLVWPLIPKLVALPSPAQLTAANGSLREEIDRRQVSEQRLLRTQNELEAKVIELTQARGELMAEIENRRELETLLESQNAQLRRSNTDLEQFASIAAHDLREPLRKIQSFSQLLTSGRYGEFNDQGNKFISSIESATGRMETLLSSLYELSRVSTQDISQEPCNLCEIVEDVKKDLQLRLEESSAEIHCDAENGLQGDKVQFRQLIQNLISNSLRYRRPDTPPVIHVTGQLKQDGEYQITVTDNGIGFDMSHRDKIFELFHRLHGRSDYPGTGVGLAICRKIAIRHGGRISAFGRPGEGANFEISIPSDASNFKLYETGENTLA